MNNRLLNVLAGEVGRCHRRGATAALRTLSEIIIEALTKRPMVIDSADREAVIPFVDDVVGEMVAHPFDDVLGGLYMAIASRYSRSGLGQYFTPMPIARLLASVSDPRPQNGDRVIEFHDTSCGSGALLLAAFERQMEFGLVERSSFTGIDLDPLCARLATAQLLNAAECSRLMPAHLCVVVGDTLRMEMRETLLIATSTSLTAEEAASLPGVTPTLVELWHSNARVRRQG